MCMMYLKRVIWDANKRRAGRYFTETCLVACDFCTDELYCLRQTSELAGMLGGRCNDDTNITAQGREKSDCSSSINP